MIKRERLRAGGRGGLDGAAANLRMGVSAFGEALRFLTILPVSTPPLTAERSVAASIPWLPAAGLVIGVLLLPVGWLAELLWDPPVRAACLVVTWGIITGGLHFDGLSDTFDAVMSWQPRERKLEIMKDSRVGAMGVTAIAIVLLLKFAWLQAAGDGWARAMLLAPVWGRWVQVYGLCWFPSARMSGLGHTYQTQTHRRGFFVATVAVLLLSVLVGQWYGIIVAVLVPICSYLLACWWTRALGGLTGDTYGAMCEIGEVVVLAVLSAKL